MTVSWPVFFQTIYLEILAPTGEVPQVRAWPEHMPSASSDIPGHFGLNPQK